MIYAAGAIISLCSAAGASKSATTVVSRPAIYCILQALLEKRYALPYKVVDTLVDTFLATAIAQQSGGSVPPLPLIWHECLLSFVRQQSGALSAQQTASLLERVVGSSVAHQYIAPEIRSILLAAKPRPNPCA